VWLFWDAWTTLVRDWWSDPDASHGLLLAPVALLLAWRRGWTPTARPQWVLGAAVLAAAVSLRYLAELSAELFTLRLSMLAAAAGLVLTHRGVPQLRHWIVPGCLLALAVPIPDVLLNAIALPLQLNASRWGADLLAWRRVPVVLTGNVLHLPGQTLFVTEACSGLRSLTALVALGILVAHIHLRSVWGGILLVASAVPVALAVNALRVFLTGFLGYHVEPAVARGFMHYTQGWVLFVVAFALLAALAAAVGAVERRSGGRREG
jgi:exosortase